LNEGNDELDENGQPYNQGEFDFIKNSNKGYGWDSRDKNGADKKSGFTRSRNNEYSKTYLKNLVKMHTLCLINFLWIFFFG
jgi:hypothetical protein